jgi:hypothetical protein
MALSPLSARCKSTAAARPHQIAYKLQGFL